MLLPVGDYPFLLRGVADRAFLDHVAALVAANADRFTPNDVDPERRRYWTMTDGGDDVLRAKKAELIARFGIGNWIADPRLHDLIGSISEGGAVHPHTDLESEGRLHLRMNVLVNKPEGGCVPLLDGIPIAVDLGDAWLCFASRCLHATTAVEGQRPRGIISYGLQVAIADSFAMLGRYFVWQRAHRADTRPPLH